MKQLLKFRLVRRHSAKASAGALPDKGHVREEVVLKSPTTRTEFLAGKRERV